MSRQLGSLHRSNSHPTNLNTPITIIPLFNFPPPDFPTSNITSGMNSDTNSNISAFYSISQLNNPNIETPDEFADSEPSPFNNFQTNSSVFSKPPFQPIPPNNPLPSISTPSYASQVIPTYSSFHSDRSSNSPDIPQISQELDNFITLQQQLLHPSTPTINQISSTIESSNPPTPTPSSAYSASLAQSSISTESSNSTNRAYRTFKRKFPNHPFPTKPGTAREYINHPHHTNTKDFLPITLPSFPQYTLNYHDINDTRSFVDEHVLMPTLHWTSYYHFTNPLCLPLSNTHNDIERNQDMLYRLTTPLTHRQFIYIGYKKSLKTFTAPRANEFTLEYYDHNIIRTNQDQFLDDDRFANPQLTEKIFIKTPYVFTLNIFDRKFDHIISEALNDMQAYESFKEKFQLFSLTFHFLAPHERDLHCSHDIMLRTKQTHTYTYYRFIQNHFDLHTPSRQPHHRFQFINSKYTSPFFLNFTYCIKFNHKLYNLIQNTPYEFAVGTEELTTIKALQLLWPLLQTKNIIRILAKLLTNSDIIHDIFPHGFFPDD